MHRLSFGTKIICWLGLILAAFAVFVPAIGFGFLCWDDQENVVHNALILPSWEHLVKIWSQPFLNVYAPLNYSAYSFLVWLSDSPRPEFFHGFNVILHFANSALVFLILRKAMLQNWTRDSKILALLTASIFCLHPIQVESVAWVVGSRDLLSAFFVLCAILTYICEIRSMLRKNFLILFFLLLAILAKPAAAAAALALLIWDILENHSFRFGKFETLWFLLILLPAMTLIPTIKFQNLEVMRYQTAWPFRPFVLIDAVGFYLNKFLLPMKLIPDYGRSPEYLLENRVWTQSFLALAVAGFVTFFRRKLGFIPRLLFIGFILLLPYLGLISFRFQDLSTVADHYVYLAVAPASLALLLSLRKLAPKYFVYFLILPFVLAALSFQQIQYWRSSDSLGHWVLQNNPKSFSFMNCLAEESARNGDYQTALDRYRESLGLQPRLLETLLGIPPVLFYLNRKQEALADYQTIEQSFVLPLSAQINRVKILINLGRREEARQLYLRLKSDFPQTSELDSLTKDL